MQIDAIVTGEREVLARLDTLAERVQKRLKARLERLVPQIEADERSRAPVRTGKLRSEIQGHVTAGTDFVVGQVRVAAQNRAEFAKAGALEYGAHGTAAVHAFSRAGHTPFGQRAEQMVDAYTRRVDVMAHRYVRGAAENWRNEAKAALEEAVSGL